jgi:hypothetical protein
MGKVKLRLSPTVARGRLCAATRLTDDSHCEENPYPCLLSLKLDCYAAILSAQA